MSGSPDYSIAIRGTRAKGFRKQHSISPPDQLLSDYRAIYESMPHGAGAKDQDLSKFLEALRLWTQTPKVAPSRNLFGSIERERSPASDDRRLQQEVAQLRAKTEALKSQLAEARRTAYRAVASADQKQATIDKLVDHVNERSRAADMLARAQISVERADVCLQEWYKGEVEEVTDSQVTVLYLVDDDEYVEQRYAVEQFLGGRTPAEGDQVCVMVVLAKVTEWNHKPEETQSKTAQEYPKPEPIEGELEI